MRKPVKKRVAAVTPPEREAQEHVKDLELDASSMAAISNIFRVANVVRNYTERELLDDFELTFTGFTVLWVLWVGGRRETNEVAADAGISKSTLTGVLKTLESHGFVEREPHPVDGRRKYVRATPKGRRKMRQLFPKFNLIEATATEDLIESEKQELTRMLRIVLNSLSR